MQMKMKRKKRARKKSVQTFPMKNRAQTEKTSGKIKLMKSFERLFPLLASSLNDRGKFIFVVEKFHSIKKQLREKLCQDFTRYFA